MEISQTSEQGQWLCLPCVILEAFQLIPLFRQRGLQIQVGTIMGQLQGTVVELGEKGGVSSSGQSAYLTCTKPWAQSSDGDQAPAGHLSCPQGFLKTKFYSELWYPAGRGTILGKASWSPLGTSGQTSVRELASAWVVKILKL